jgi:hypothetical protein
MQSLNRGKGTPIMWATSVIFKKLLRVNNHPLGENSPNPVPLITWNMQPMVRINNDSHCLLLSRRWNRN